MSLSNWQFVARLQYIDGSNLRPVSNLLLDSTLLDLNLLPGPVTHGFIALGFMQPDCSVAVTVLLFVIF